MRDRIGPQGVQSETWLGAIAGIGGIAGLLSVGKGRACMLRVACQCRAWGRWGVAMKKMVPVASALGWDIQGAVLRT